MTLNHFAFKNVQLFALCGLTDTYCTHEMPELLLSVCDMLV